MKRSKKNGKTGRIRIGVSLPYLFTVRDWLFSPVWQQMLKRNDCHFILLGAAEHLEELIKERQPENITYLPFHIPLGRRPFYAKYLYSLRKYVYAALMYRFTSVNQLSHYKVRRKRGKEEKRRHQVFSSYPMGEKAGWPFPQSKTLFNLLYYLHCNGLVNPHEKHLEFLKSLNLDMMVFGRLHAKETAYWAQCFKSIGKPSVGVVASWDHPTTQGPTPPGMSYYIVASQKMAQEMAELHGIDPARIKQIGKVQMDEYLKPDSLLSREAFLEELGVPAKNSLILFGPNTTGLKEHEVSIARRLAKWFGEKRYGEATLLIRAHPQDMDWQRDFLPLHNPPAVLVQKAASFGFRSAADWEESRKSGRMLANLMKHASIVLQSRGSLALDAIAFDTPVVSLAFDGDLKRSENDSFLREYEYEHYKPLVAAKGTWMVGSYDRLDHAIRAYLRDPSIHAQGRMKIRQEQLEPLDGMASQRLVDEIVKMAEQARDGVLPPGDWGYCGLGDLGWARKQRLDIRGFVES